VCLQAASVGLLHHMRHPQVAHMCSLLVDINAAAEDAMGAVSALLQVWRLLMAAQAAGTAARARAP
jgi:hypothetical protein